KDWRVLVTASAVVALDHFGRGLLWPESVYGTAVGASWRWLEHAGWVVFIDCFLILSCRRSRIDTRLLAQRQAELEAANESIEQKVLVRTRELQQSEQRFRTLADHSPVGIFQ